MVVVVYGMECLGIASEFRDDECRPGYTSFSDHKRLTAISKFLQAHTLPSSHTHGKYPHPGFGCSGVGRLMSGRSAEINDLRRP
ncbi:hypothetical protein MASR1M12_16260 [Erysipelotrichia bacterium]